MNTMPTVPAQELSVPEYIEESYSKIDILVEPELLHVAVEGATERSPCISIGVAAFIFSTTVEFTVKLRASASSAVST